MENNFNNKPQTPPSNNLVLSIIATFLCLPLGIIGILNATKVDALYAAGDYESAQKHSEAAKKWSIFGFIGWAVVVVLYVIMIIVLAALGSR